MSTTVRRTKPTTPGPPSSTANFFVSKNGNNTNGLSWATAWTDLDQINWGVINSAPSKVIEVDGGPTSCGSDYQGWATHATSRPGVSAGMVYTGNFAPTINGTVLAPIVLRASKEAGRNGTVVIFGGRTTALPQAGSTSYAPAGIGRDKALNLENRSYITIDGARRSGMMIYGFGAQRPAVGAYGTQTGGAAWGISLTTGSHDITIRNVEAFDCGTYGQVTIDNSWKSDQPGMSLGGSNITVERSLFHDCGQDPVQGKWPVHDLIFRDCMMYGNRAHSVWTGYGFNSGCQGIPQQNTTHCDGIQSYDGLNNGPALFDHCVIGPFVNQGIYLGDGGLASYDNVTITESLFMGIQSHGIQGDTLSTSTPAGWDITKCTMNNPSTRFAGYTGSWLMVEIESGTGHSIRDCILTWSGSFYGNQFFTGQTSSNNWHYGAQSTVVPGGTRRNPLFVNPIAETNIGAVYTDYKALDLTPTDPTIVASGAGTTHLRRIQDLFDRIDALNG